jgi:uncharacterized membrane protein HdeD (DUF308 family)
MNPNSTSRQSFYAACISAALTLAIGITLTAAPSILVTVCRAAGGLLCAAGLVLIVLYFIKQRSNPPFLYYGLMAAGVGTLLVLLPGLLNFLIPVLFGLWVLINSLIGILRNIGFRGEHRFWWLGAAFNTVGAALGVYIITRPMAVMETTVRLIGIALIAFAVLRAVSVIMARHYFADRPTGDVIDVTLKKD